MPEAVLGGARPWLSRLAVALFTVAAAWMALAQASVQHADGLAGTPPLADEAALLAAPTASFSLWRLRDDPAIFVAIFPSLHAQAMALNRVAAFVERPDAPHTHVLADATLRALLGSNPAVFDAYYYGHDYRAADLVRFYAAAAADGVALNAEEQALHAQLMASGLLQPGLHAALISLPPKGDGVLEPAGRTAILHHELSHGAYFTVPAYAEYVVQFWRGLTWQERAVFRAFLGAEGYDAGNDDLMRNETQAYLVFTDDPRMFDAGRLGLTEAAALRARFAAGVPVGWLKRDYVP